MGNTRVFFTVAGAVAAGTLILLAVNHSKTTGSRGAVGSAIFEPRPLPQSDQNTKSRASALESIARDANSEKTRTDAEAPAQTSAVFNAEDLRRFGPGTIPANRAKSMFAIDFRDPVKVPSRHGGIIKVQSRSFLTNAENADVRVRPAPGTERIAVGEGTIYRVGPGGALASVGKATFNDDGEPPDVTAGDGEFSSRVTSAMIATAFPSRLSLKVMVQQADDDVAIEFLFEYTGRPPATIIGVRGSSIENGSLAFHVDVDVTESGQYEWLGRLVDQSGRGVAILKSAVALSAGLRDVQLQAYGLFLRAAGQGSGLSLRDIEGWRITVGGGSQKEAVVPWRQSYTVPKIDLSKLTESPWTAEPAKPLVPNASAIRLPSP